MENGAFTGLKIYNAPGLLVSVKFAPADAQTDTHFNSFLSTEIRALVYGYLCKIAMYLY